MSLTLASDMDNIFLDSGFEESIVYTASGGDANTINAVVYRDGYVGKSYSKSRSYSIEIDVSTNDVSTVTINKDSVKLYKNQGDDERTTFTVAGIVAQDAGGLTLGLR